MPRYGVIQTIVSPKQLTAYNKGRRPEDVQPSRLVGVLIISAPDRFRICYEDYAVGVLTDLGDASALLEAEPDILAHMNADHADTCRLYATKLLGAADGDWRCVGCDPEGMELQNGRTALRLFFPQRIISPGGVRQSLKELAEKARAQA